MNAGLDTGDILLQESMPMPPDATAATLLATLGERGAKLALQAIEGRNNNTLKPQPQPTEGVTHAAKLTREDGRIDWTQPAQNIERQTRALQPWPGCFFMLGNEPIKLLSASIIDKSGPPGTLLDDQFTVACGTNALRLDKLQRPGKGHTDGASMLRGLRLPIGHKL
jgi:methionyl-tRNA formyltransferase